MNSQAAQPGQVFIAPRRRGLIAYGLLTFFFSVCGGLSLYYSLNQQRGIFFIQYLLISLLLFSPLPFFIYRIYSLLNATYTINRNGLSLNWGIRSEDIPLPDIDWVRPATDLTSPLPLPFLSFLGILRGTISTEGLGQVEFLASEVNSLLLIATKRHIFAISPSDVKSFLRAFQNAIERGSISPLTAHTTHPTAFLGGMWSDIAARLLILGGFSMTLALVVLTSFIIPSKQSISLGYHATGEAATPGPPERLMLLPVLAILFFIFDFILAAIFFRKEEQRPISYLIWSGGLLTSILLTIAVILSS
jgi:hypothetical protein